MCGAGVTPPAGRTGRHVAGCSPGTFTKAMRTLSGSASHSSISAHGRRRGASKISTPSVNSRTDSRRHRAPATTARDSASPSPPRHPRPRGNHRPGRTRPKGPSDHGTPGTPPDPGRPDRTGGSRPDTTGGAERGFRGPPRPQMIPDGPRPRRQGLSGPDNAMSILAGARRPAETGRTPPLSAFNGRPRRRTPDRRNSLATPRR
jgi:hypothetical protein